tara:strand:- start:241 stop:1170 length:930 start_codon:yes stop_codon:yes gene_type:complete
MSFEKLKANRLASIEKLVGAVEPMGEKKSYIDEREWKPTVDKAGNGYAVIRFLPATGSEDLPWVRYWDHGFKGPTGRWYFEKSLTSIGKDDPLGEMNSQMWNTGREEDKEVVRERKRRLHYVSNILVISDSANPQNEGRVFLYNYGKKIFDKIMDVMQPQFEDEKPINPFDFWGGANFKMKIRNVEGYRNYDKSEFDSVSEFFDGDEEKLKTIYDNLHGLEEFTDPSNYKTYGELKKKLYEVLGEEEIVNNFSVEQTAELNETRDVVVDAPTPSTPTRKSEDQTPTPSGSDRDGKEDDTLAYFAKLAQE